MKKQPLPPDAMVDTFHSGDEMAPAIRAKDWSQTALGPMDRWPAHLRASVELCVNSSLPTAIAWGRARVHLFNDAYRDLRSPKRAEAQGRENRAGGDRGRESLGRDIREFWSQAWSVLREPFEQALNGVSRKLEQRVFFDGEGRLAERFFTFSSTPIRSESGDVHGVLHQVIDQTQSMLASRRTALLQMLAATARNAASEDEVSRLLIDVVRSGELDVPFALLYQANGEATQARLVAAAGLTPGHAASPQLIALHESMPWPLAAAAARASEPLEPIQIDGLAARFPGWKCGPYAEPPSVALVYRLPSTNSPSALSPSKGATDAFLIVGVSARRELDTPYREFFDRLAVTLGDLLDRGQDQARRRQRATAVAELEHDLSALADEVFTAGTTIELPPPREVQPTGLLQHLLTGMHEAFAAFDREWRYVWINPAAAALTGQSAADLTGKTLWDVQPAWLDSALEDACRNAMAGESQQLICWNAKLERWLEHQLAPTADGFLIFTRDITAERRAAAALADSEERLRFATQTGKVGLWYWDVTDDRVEWSDSLYPMHGISPEQFDGTRKAFIELVHPEDRTLVSDAIRATLADEAPYELEFRVQKPSGEVTWLFANATVLRDEDGRALRMLGATIDIDQRKRMELALRESEERFAKAFHSSPLILTIAACDSGELLEVNATFTRVCGYARDAVIGRTIDDLGLSIQRNGKNSAPFNSTSPVSNAECRLRTRSGTDLVGVLSTEHIEIGGRRCVLSVIQDITERQRAEEALRASEQRFARFMQHHPGLAWIKDLTGHYIFASENTAKIFGRPQSEIYGRTDADLFDSATSAVFSRHDRQALASEAGIQVVETLTHPDGSLHHSIVNKFPIQDAGGKPMLIGGVAIDITEEKRREAALAESEARFRMVADNIAALAWSMDSTGRITWVNRRWSDYTGLALETVVGQTRTGLVHPEHASRVLESMEGCLRSGEPWEETFPVRGSDGQYRWFLCRAVPIRDASGAITQWFGTNTDITEHQLAEQAARRQTERLRLLWEAASQLLVGEDSETILEGLFGRIAAHFGLDAYFHYVLDEEAGVLRLQSSAGVDTNLLDAWRELRCDEGVCGTPAAHRESFAATFLQTSATDASAERLRALGMRSYVSNPLMVGERLLGTLSFASRSHDEFAADDLEFFRTMSSYTTVAHERLRLLRELKDDDRRKDEFLATLAHELRNPLAPIRNGLEIIRMTRGNPDKMEQARLMMERQLQQMVRLIDDLLDLSRISRGKIDLRRERVDLRIVLQHAIETSRPLIERHRHQLTLDIPQSPALFVEADLTRLAQVFANLLNNAAKYTPNGGLISLTLREEDGHAVIAVKDNGDGIPTHMLARVFDMFAQVDRSLDRPSAGLGIGLNIVKRLVEMHGGTVSVTSGGRSLGSEFVVRLPLLQVQHAASLLLDAELISANPAGCRVLVADDNVDAAVSLATLLKMLGHDVRTAHDGQEAVDIASAFQPELILLDIGMPKLDGYDACTRIRELPIGNDSLMVALTVWDHEEDKHRATAAGFDEHLVKPVDAADLERLLTRVTGDSQVHAPH